MRLNVIVRPDTSVFVSYGTSALAFQGLLHLNERK